MHYWGLSRHCAEPWECRVNKTGAYQSSWSWSSRIRWDHSCGNTAPNSFIHSLFKDFLNIYCKSHSTRGPKISKTWFLISRFSGPILETNMRASSDGTKTQVRRWNMRYGKGNLSLAKQVKEGFLEEATSELKFKGWRGVCQIFKQKKGRGEEELWTFSSKQRKQYARHRSCRNYGAFQDMQTLWDCWNIKFKCMAKKFMKLQK